MRHLAHASITGAAVAALSLAGCAANGPSIRADPVPGEIVTATPTPTTTPTTATTTHTITGTLTVLGSLSQADTIDGPCTADSLDPGGFDDITPGTQVSVYDGDRRILALAELGAGRLTMGEAQEIDDWSAAPDSPSAPAVEAPQAEWDAYFDASSAYSDAITRLPKKTVYWGPCTFDFSLEVPDAEFYAIEVAHRGAVNFARDQLAADGWIVGLSLG